MRAWKDGTSANLGTNVHKQTFERGISKNVDGPNESMSFLSATCAGADVVFFCVRIEREMLDSFDSLNVRRGHELDVYLTPFKVSMILLFT